MPVFNTEKFLEESIRSIQHQTVSDWELIAVDDSSTDGSLELLRELASEDTRIRVVAKDTNGGAGSCYNAALELARGDFLALMDSDDLSPPNRFEKSLEILRSEPKVFLVGSSRMHVFEDGEKVSVEPLAQPVTPPTEETARRIATRLIFNSIFLQPTVMARRSAWGSMRYTSTRFAEDFEVFTQAVNIGWFAEIPEPVGYYRMHPGQTTRRVASKHQLVIENVYRPFFQRLGINASNQELEIHSVLALTWRGLQQQEVPALQSWVLKLRDAVKNWDLFSSDEYDAIVLKKVFDLARSSPRIRLEGFRLFKWWKRMTKLSWPLAQQCKLFLKGVLSFGK